MISEDLYESDIRSRGDLGAVFECDGETSYFYLVETSPDLKILGYIFVLNGKPDFGEKDIAIKWDRAERKVGLFIKSQLWAVFDEFGAKYGGRYHPDRTANIPEDIAQSFAPFQN